MNLKDTASLGKLLAHFLLHFADCFSSAPGTKLLAICVRGLLSDVQRKKNAEAIALDQGVAPRTLQRFLESIVWLEELLRDKCQQMVAKEHADPHAIGIVDEPEPPKAAITQPESNASTTAIAAKWKTASTASPSPMPPRLPLPARRPFVLAQGMVQ